jgi:hypothetical protein
MAMANGKRKLWQFGVVAFLGVGMVGLAMPGVAHAGGVHLSIGIGVPAPVYVEPAPLVVAPAPVFVRPAPVITYPSPVVIAEPPVVYARRLPPGLAKRYDGYYPAYGYKYYKHWKHRDD